MPYWLNLIIAIVAVLAGTKLFGRLVARLGQSGSLGEIIAGVVLGGSALKLLDPHDPIIHALSQAGILVVLFSAGLYTNPSALLRPGKGARPVAVAGVVVPFVLGAGAIYFLGGTWIEALIAGAAMGATSVHVSVRALRELGMLDSGEGRVVQGAAVIDDAISLAIVAVVMGLVTEASSTADLVLRSLLVPSAFIAGLLFDAKGLSGNVERVTTWLYWVLAPFLFAVTGALLDLRAIAGGRALLLTGVLVLVGTIGKVVAGWAPRQFAGNRLIVGAAMVPRGAIGLIFAQLGLAAGAIEGSLFAAIVLLVFVTSILTPPTLKSIARSHAAANAPAV